MRRVLSTEEEREDREASHRSERTDLTGSQERVAQVATKGTEMVAREREAMPTEEVEAKEKGASRETEEVVVLEVTEREEVLPLISSPRTESHPLAMTELTSRQQRSSLGR